MCLCKSFSSAEQTDHVASTELRAYRDVSKEHEGFVQGGFQLLICLALVACPQLNVNIFGYQLSWPAASISESVTVLQLYLQHMRAYACKLLQSFVVMLTSKHNVHANHRYITSARR